jgi:ABC-2 type transport system ATP-binding protein
MLQVNALSFAYHKILVFEDVSFQLGPGQIAALTGRNGSGKTTLMRCLAGWAPCTSGSITLCGEPFDGSSQKLRSQIFFVNDTPAFYDDLTAEEHIRFILSLNRRSERIPRAEELLRKFGLFTCKNQFPSSYSRGMRLALALCIALTLEPALMLLDEPFGPLDSKAAALLCTELVAAAGRGSAVLLSMHQPVAGLSADLHWKLEEGRLFSLDCENCLQSDEDCPTTHLPGEDSPEKNLLVENYLNEELSENPSGESLPGTGLT